MIYNKQISDIYIAIEKEDQVKLYEDMKNGDESSRNEIINSCLPLVYKIANKFHFNNKHIDLEDFIQQGNLALIKAVDNWDINISNITTITTKYVTNYLIDMIKDSKYNVKTRYDITKHAVGHINKIKKVDSNDIQEISNKTGLKIKRIKVLMEIMQTKRIDYTSLAFNENKICSETKGEINGCLADVINLVEENIADKTDRDIFMSWIKHLNKSNKIRIVANKLNVPPNMVSSSIKNTKNILREIVKNGDN
ncbi:MAG: sigma-70 family RNA polymerase sigma factor [Candidatus Lokiarchaeota archaeon]|nr:sigma-70 family RNA polymerase sigma factor [Candidatus Lokiarchaeota archaeon]